jgi:flagellar assembly protein FliH
MPRLTLKLPQKLNRVEIIRGKDLKPTDYFSFIPLDKIPIEKELNAIFETEVAELRNQETEKELFIDENIPIIHQYYHEISFIEQLKPVPLLLDKLPIDSLPLEEVRVQVQQSYEKGFKDGQEVTRDLFSDEFLRQQQWVKKFDTLSNKLRASYTDELKKLEELIISLGMMTAKHILEAEITKNSDLVINQVKKAIYEAEKDTIFKIMLHPANIEILENVKSDLLNSGVSHSRIEIIADSSIGEGGCILDTSAGIIDAKIDTQLKVIKTKLESIPKSSLLDTNPEDFGFDTNEFS